MKLVERSHRGAPSPRHPQRFEEKAMKIGVPTEVKEQEYRVAMTPAGGAELTEHGAEVFVQAGAGVGSGIADEDYAVQGAAIVADAAAVFAAAETIVKVKEPQPAEVAMLEPRHTLFTYLHLAPDPELTQGLIDSGATCVAYETITDAAGRRLHAGTPGGRLRRPPWRRPRRRRGQGAGDRRRHRRRQRGADGGRPRRRRDRPRPLDRSPARTRQHL